MNVFLIEDEDWVRADMEQLLDRYTGRHRIYAFATGLEAVDYAEHTAPDMVITDIRMPGIDGLETIERLQALAPQLCCIILSGYDDFQYAQRGLRLGVKDFLLKPVPTEELYHTLDRLLKEQEGTRETQLRTLKYELGHMLRGTGTGREPGLLPAGGRWAAAVMLLVNWEAAVPAAMLEAVQWTAAAGDSPACGLIPERGLVLEADHNVYVRLWPLLAESDADLRQQAYEWHRQCSRLGTAHTVFICAPGEGLALDNLYKKALTRLEDGFVPGRPAFADGLLPKQAEFGGFWDMAKIIEVHLRSGSYTELRKSIGQLLLWLHERRVPAREAERQLTNLLYALRFTMREQAAPLADLPEIEGLGQLLRRVEAYSELAPWLEERLTALTEREGDGVDSPKGLVQRLKKEVASGYGGSVSLQLFAQRHHISVGYMSRLFKSETGVNFSEYLTSYRLDKALALLRDEALSLGDISALVGYEDPKYFSHMFKKRFGSPPNQYRDRKNSPPNSEK
ncbi:response regulator transcription factor [Paenibacillus sp. y28]|uniref:response regulator transcription factor n=1 Tax=Paenibacillus sp. y28 TaxID=3129110 RepID=UPI00301B5130